MLSDNPSKIKHIEFAISVLNQALEQLHEHDYASAQVMVGVVRQVLEDLHLDFEHHFQVEKILKQVLDPSCK